MLIRSLRSNDGSAMIEAAIVFPIVILVLAIVISKTVVNSEAVNSSAVTHECEFEEFLSDTKMTCEDYLRGRWLVK